MNDQARRLKEAMDGKGSLGAPKPKMKEQRISDVVARMSLEQRRALYNQLVDSFGDEPWD